MPVRFTDSHKIQHLSTIHLSDYCSAIFILTRRKTGSIVKTKKPESFCFSDSMWVYLEAGLLHTLCAQIKISLSPPTCTPFDNSVVIRGGRKPLGKYPTLMHSLLGVHTQCVRACALGLASISRMTVKTITSEKSQPLGPLENKALWFTPDDQKQGKVNCLAVDRVSAIIQYKSDTDLFQVQPLFRQQMWAFL